MTRPHCNVIEVVVIGCSDVSEMRRHEEVSKILQMTCEANHVPLLIFDRNSIVIYVSTYFSSLLGYGREELQGLKLRKLGFRADCPDFRLDQAFSWSGELEFSTKGLSSFKRSGRVYSFN